MAPSKIVLAIMALCCSAALVSAAGIMAPAKACASYKPSKGYQTLKANKDTVHWGYYYKNLRPQLVVSSGDKVMVEMITHHAGDDYDKMIKGDPGVESIYKWTAKEMGVPTRGATGQGDGVHILTGPIYVCGAEPGDVLQVDILDLQPRKNPSTGKTYGSNAAAWWGFHFRAGFKNKIAREVITIYEIIRNKASDILYAVPDYQFTFADPKKKYPGPTSPCVPLSGVIPTTFTNIVYKNKIRSYSPGVTVPCVGGKQTWKGYYFPGLVTSHPTGTEDYSIRGKFKVPVNFHIGNIGLASNYSKPTDSVPPMVTGGNVDNRRTGKGASLFYPVQVKGAYLTMGDAHTAQGDSELDGTGIETSINGWFKITLHKKGKLPKKVQNLKSPLLENANEYVIHGFTVNNWLALKNPGDIYGKSALDPAMANAYRNVRDWLMTTYGLTEDQAITAITVGVDFAVTQVVDGNWGVHAVVPKYMFDKAAKGPYKPKTVCGSSVKA